MSRSLLLSLIARAKSEGIIDAAVRYNPFARRRAGATLRILHEGTQADIRAQCTQLKQRIMNAAGQTRYGQMRSGEWPVIGKQDVLQEPKDFVNYRVFPRLPAGTGGTTGMPLRLWRSLECIAAEQLFIDDLLAPSGFSMRSKMAVLRADNVKPVQEQSAPYGRITHGGRRLTLSSPHLNAETLPWYAEALARFSPSVLWVYPSAAVNLLTLMQQAGRALRIPVILASSEDLPGPVHQALESYFGAQVINYYGQAERACLAVSTQSGAFRFNPAYGEVELLPADEAGVFRIVATGFWNTAMPMVRYDTGDLLRAPHDTSPENLLAIARGEAIFSGLAGRGGEYILTRDGMRIIGLNHIPKEVDHIAQIQLVQPDYETVLVHVKALPGFGSAQLRQLREQARAKLPASFTVSVEAVNQLTQTSRGKTPFVIRKLD